MILRPYQTEDFAAIETVYNAAKLDELRFEHCMFTLLPLRKDKERLQALLASNIYVADNNGILGYGAYKDHEICAILVLPQARGQGVGTRLLRHLCALASTPVKLQVAQSNQLAKSWYERYGFRISAEFVTAYNGIAVAANEMTLQKPPPAVANRSDSKCVDAQ